MYVANNINWKKKDNTHKSIRIFLLPAKKHELRLFSTKKSFTCPGYMDILRGKRICGYTNDPTHILNIKENTNLPFVERVSLGLIGNLNRAETLNDLIQKMSLPRLCQPWNCRFATLNLLGPLFSFNFLLVSGLPNTSY